ncbi:MAG: nucleoside triphosphate pyrophosphohydrolase [Alphaproteobacteria bacterium]|nr:nucleoside triphosphate pyrophosphohydrolase [Alphaproteobacteria bacterium]
MSDSLNRLLDVMAALRTPETGCPWDLEQDFSTIAPYTIEEAYEVADAIHRGDMTELRDELGDLLLQVVFHARMAEERNAFRFEDVAAGIADKMVRRHPHVFGEQERGDAAGVTETWEQVKARERAEKGQDSSVLDGVALSLPALMRAEKLSKRAARVGFTWPDAAAVLEKLDEEVGELRTEIDNGADPDRLEDEMGDVLFVVANLARLLGVDPEKALERTNRKFIARFQQMETALTADGRGLSDYTLEEMDAGWDRAKQAEKAGASQPKNG